MPALLAIPARLVARAPRAAPIVHRALGAVTLGLSYHVVLRTAAIDDAVRSAVAAGIAQLVVLGAGLDARAQRLCELRSVRVFEVDAPSMIRRKRERLVAIAPDALGRVTLVAVDFERQGLEEALSSAGLSGDEPAMWVWEGVTVYLTSEAIRATLCAIGRLSAPKSRIAVTYVTPERFHAIGRVVARAIGEPLRGPLTPDAMRAELDRAGFHVIADESTGDWAARYWGDVPRGLRDWERLAVAVFGARS